MKILVIKEAKWLRGGDFGIESNLLTLQGDMCCLGFLGKSCGATDADLLDRGTPQSAGKVAWPEGLLDERRADTVLCHEIVNTNDNFEIGDVERKRRLAPLFAQIGYELHYE